MSPLSTTDRHETSPPARWPRWTISALAAITLLGFGLRLLNLRESLWLDELHTGWVVKDAWSDVAGRAQIGNQSPLWFHAVKGVTSLLGESEATLRLLSLLAGTALMPAAFWLVRSLTSNREHHDNDGVLIGGLLAAALVAVDRHAIFYATEARPYACVQLVAALQLALFVRNLRQPTTYSRLGCIALTGLLFHLHYTALVVVLGELLVLAAYYWFSRTPVPYRPWRALFDGQVALMLCLPALPHVWQVFQRRQMWEPISATAHAGSLWHLFPLDAMLMAAAASALLVLGTRWLPPAWHAKGNWKSVALVAAWFLVPLLAIWCLARFQIAPILLRRYLMAVALGPMLLTGLLIARWPGRSLSLVASAGLVLFATHQSQIIEQIRYDGRAIGDRNEDWRGAISFLNREWPLRKSPVLVDAGLIEEDFWLQTPSEIPPDELTRAQREEYLTFPLRSLYWCDIPSQEMATIESLALVQPDVLTKLWVVRRGDGFQPHLFRLYDTVPFPPGSVSLHQLELKQETTFGGVHVLELTSTQGDE